ncbi:MAG: TetR/AcrR family transcriptional regulator [Breznakibacter sp.]
MNQPKSLKRRDEINAAAMELFVEKGFQASINDLVRKLGIAKGTFYHHFPEKEALIVDLYKTLMFEVEEKCVYPFRDCGPVEFQRKVLGEIVKWFITHPTKFYYIALFENSPYIKKTFGRIEETLENPRQIISQKVNMGVFKPFPADMIAFFDFSFTRSAAYYFLSLPDPLAGFEKGFGSAFELYWTGVAKK